MNYFWMQQRKRAIDEDHSAETLSQISKELECDIRTVKRWNTKLWGEEKVAESIGCHVTTIVDLYRVDKDRHGAKKWRDGLQALLVSRSKNTEKNFPNCETGHAPYSCISQ